MPYVKGTDRNQLILFPESIDDYISSDNPVRVIDTYVEQLNLVIQGFNFAICPKHGRPPYDPRVMLKLYLYGYLNRIRSSRRLEHETKRNIELIWLLEKRNPDFKTIADFRKNNKKALKKIFRDFAGLCKEWGLFSKEMVAIDGTKFKASNSKKNNYSRKKIEQRLKYIEEKINSYLDELDQNDELEKTDRSPTAEEIKKRIEELKKRQIRYEQYEQELEESGENEISTVDPDARLMVGSSNNVNVSYNVQTTVEAKNKLIIDYEVTSKPNDLGQLAPMALRAKQVLETTEIEVLADKGYYRADCLKECVENSITPYVSKQTHSNQTGKTKYYADKFKYDKQKDIYICPAGEVLKRVRTRRTKKDGIVGYDYGNNAVCQKCQDKIHCTKSKKGRTIYRNKDQDFLDQIDSETFRNKDKYKLRQMIVEHPFGTIKHVWDAGYYLTRGVDSVSAETALSYLAYNFKRAINILGVKEMVRRLQERRNPGFA